MPVTEEVIFHSQGQKIAATLSLPSAGAQGPCLVACHGYRSHRHTEKWAQVTERLVGEGFVVLRFDFRGCGESEGEAETVLGRVADLQQALKFLEGKRLTGQGVGLLGSSLGGSVCLLAAAQFPQVQAVVIWATPSRLDQLFPAEVEPQAVLSAAEKISCPLLIIHGNADELVGFHQAYEIYRQAPEPKKLVIIEGGDHTFTQPSHRRRVFDLSVHWFRHYLPAASGGG